MRARQVLDRTTTPDGSPMELAIEGGQHVLRLRGAPLMSSAAHASEEAMARVAREVIGARPALRILVGGLGMGFTLRSSLDVFGEPARITVAELMPEVVRYNRELLGELAGRPLDDPRVTVFQGNVREPLARGGWDVVLMDVDNGPAALTIDSNQGLYDARGVRLMANSLSPGGVLVLWSVSASRPFVRLLHREGLRTQTRTASARDGGKGGKHVLFVAERPLAPKPARRPR